MDDTFKKYFAATPILIGAGITAQRAFADDLFRPRIDNRLAALEAVTKNYFTAPSIPSWHISALQKMAEDTPLSSETIQRLWREASAVTDPLGIQSSDIANRMIGTTGSEALSDLAFSLRGSQSAYMHSTASKFIENLEFLTGRAREGLSVEVSSRVHEVPMIGGWKGVNVSAVSELGGRAHEELLEVGKSLGAEVELRKFSRSDMPGSELRAIFTVREGGKIDPGRYEMKMPNLFDPSKPELVTRGTTQQSRYIAGIHAVFDGNQFTASYTHPQWMIHQLKESVVPELLRKKITSQREVNTKIREMTDQAAKYLDWYRTVPEGQHQGIEDYVESRRQIIRPHTIEGKDLPREEAYRILRDDIKFEGESLFPSYSASQAAKGTFSRIDPRIESGLVPEAASYSRRPMKWMRADYAPTIDAIELMEKNPINKQFGWMAHAVGVDNPMVRVSYINPSVEGVERFGVSEEGMMLMSRSIRKQFEHEVVRTPELSEISSELEDIISSGSTKIKKGTWLGWDTERTPIKAEADLEFLRIDPFEDPQKKAFWRVTTLERVMPDEHMKVEGGNKAMVAFRGVEDRGAKRVGYDYLESVIGSAGGRADSQAAMSMDILKKEKHRLWDQVIGWLWKNTSENMQSGKSISDLSRRFATDPFAITGVARDFATEGGEFNEARFLRFLGRIGRGGQLTERQWGETFSAVPFVFGDKWESMIGKISPSARESILNTKVAEGVAQFFYSGPGAPGMGDRATIEPRLIELFSDTHMGDLGPEVTRDISERMMMNYPERFREQNILRQARESVINLRKIEGALSPAEMMAAVPEGAGLPSEAAALHVPGFGDINIPEEGFIKQTTSRSTGDKTIYSPLANQYRNVIETASKMEQGIVGRPAMQTALDQLMVELATEERNTITGNYGLLKKSRLHGSRSITVVTPSAFPELASLGDDPRTVGLTDEMAELMFRDIERMKGRESVARYRSAFEAGEAVPGMMFRHPVIGQESAQFVNYKRMPDKKGAYAVVNEMKKRVQIQVGNELVEKEMRFGPAVGQAMDFDADPGATIFFGEDTGERVRRHIESTRSEWEQFQIRTQILKAKKAAETATEREGAAAAMIKLGVPESELGQLSNILTGAKSAVRMNTEMSRMDRELAEHILERVEQDLISSKHIPEKSAMKMMALFKQAQSGFRQKNAGMLSRMVRSMLSDDPTTAAMLSKGFRATIMEKGGPRTIDIPGLNLERTFSNITNSMRLSEEVTANGISAAGARALYTGKTKMTPHAARNMYSDAVKKLSPFGAFFGSSEKGLMQGLVERGGEITNRLAAAGKRILQHSRPLGIGIGAAIGIATVLSSPRDTLSPDQKSAPRVNLKSGSGGENIDAADMSPSVNGFPTAQNLVNGTQTARISPRGYNVRVRGRSPGGSDFQTIGGNIQSITNMNTSVSITDRRTSLTPQKVSDILDE